MANKYYRRSRISEAKFRQIVKLFALDLEASKIAILTGISRQSICKICIGIRTRISEFCEQQSPFETGEIEVDESFFGARRVRGVRGRGARGKTIVFGLLKRGGKVYTQVVKNCSAAVLTPIIKGKADSDSIIYSDGFKAYDGLVNFGYKRHHRVKHGENQFADGRNHINGIENFWGIAKARLAKFRGLKKQTFNLHLKECEFRFNHPNQDTYKLLLKMLKNNPI